MTDAAQLVGLSEDERIRSTAIGLVEHTLRDGFDRDAGGAYNEGPLGGPASDKKKIWWVQAEALVGLLNGFELTGNFNYQKWFLRQANFVRNSMFDHEFGEWFHTIGEDGGISSEKAGEWREPYHQSRACLEIIKRIERVTTEDSTGRGKSPGCASKVNDRDVERK
jgi:mannobiose 2-epimerase